MRDYVTIPGVTPDYTLSSLTQPSGPRRRRPWLIVSLVAGAALLVAATAGITLTLAAKPSGAPQAVAGAPRATPADTFTIEGYLELTKGQFTWKGADDPTCAGMNGFDDLASGAQVTIFDAAGKALTVGQLDTGRAFDIKGDFAGSCRLTFSIPKVPSGVGPYGITITHRTAGHYAEADLRSGAVEMTV